MQQNTTSKLKKFLIVTAVIILIFFAIIFGTIIHFYNKYDLDIAKLTSLNNGIKVYSTSGQENALYNTNRSLINIEELPDYVKQAFIDTEDKRFYQHNGYDIKRIIKASIVNLKSGDKTQGASTISQQLIKNALLSNEKTYSRKIQEVMLSIKLEKQFSKKDILEMYLNTIYFGSNAYGLENASKIYYNKSAKDLSINEACSLAGIIKSPKKYSPKNNINLFNQRKNLVASLMKKQGHISETDYQQIINNDLSVFEYSDFDSSYEEEAIYEACKLLNLSERELINRGYEIVTFKDCNLQKSVIENNSLTIIDTSKEYSTNLDSVTIITDNKGKILAYYANSNYNLHNMKRQPASTLKPLAVYLPCIGHNILSPSTHLLDEPINYAGFAPNNPDNNYHGYITVRQAINKSYNVPAVKALDYLGVEKACESLNGFNIPTSKDDKNLSLALGCIKNGVTLTQLANAYSILANLGTDYGLSFIDKILDKNGNIIYEHENYIDQKFDAGDCYIINDMLKSVAQSGTAKRLNELNMPIASKTGTATDGKNVTDLYNVAYTSNHTVLTWIGNIKDNKLCDGLYSSIQPTEINKNILKYLYKDNQPSDFVKPENHRLVAPNKSTPAKDIGYDLFKIDNPPEIIEDDIQLDLSVVIDNYSAVISCPSSASNKIEVYRVDQNGEKLMNTTHDNRAYRATDKNIFGYDEIIYYAINQYGEKSNIVKIRPNDYIANYFENQIMKGKKKWYV